MAGGGEIWSSSVNSFNVSLSLSLSLHGQMDAAGYIICRAQAEAMTVAISGRNYKFLKKFILFKKKKNSKKQKEKKKEKKRNRNKSCLSW